MRLGKLPVLSSASSSAQVHWAILFSMIHHSFYWYFPKRFRAVDHRELVRSLRNDGLAAETLKEDGRPTPDVIMDAWIVVTKPWHERTVENKRIEGANPRAHSMADLVHSIGACRVALWIGAMFSFVLVVEKVALEWHWRVESAEH
jgi:hypothetical protein